MKIVFMGDSITAGFKQLSNYENIINIGVGGYKTTENIHLVKELRLKRPDVVFLMIGINDFLCNKRFFEHGYTIPFHKSYDLLIDMITTNLPKAKIYLTTMLPMHERPEGQLTLENVLRYNTEIDIINHQFIKQKAQAYKCHFFDLAKHFIKDGLLNKDYSVDGIHLNEKGYNVYLEALQTLEPNLFTI